jgi:hypothetical protein
VSILELDASRRDRLNAYSPPRWRGAGSLASPGGCDRAEQPGDGALAAAAEDRDIVRGSLETVGDWRLTQPADVPGQSIRQADYVLIAEIFEVERFEQQATEHIQRLTDDLEHLVSSRGMLVVRPVL